MTNILVTGGAGYIGSHVCKLLKKRGYQPVVLDNFSTGHKELVKWGPCVEGSILDESLLDTVMKQYQPEAVMHFAAHSVVSESVLNPDKYFGNNVGGTLSLLRAMRKAQVSNLVFSSTAAVFGIPEVIPITEDSATHPVNPYGESKLKIEKELQTAVKEHGLQSISLRYFNAAGADPEGETGELHDPETHLIPNILKAAFGVVPYVTVFGDDYETPDGSCVRDYIHVMDLADAHIRALEQLMVSQKTMVINLGTGVGNSVLEVIAMVKQVTGRSFLVNTGERRAGDPAVLVCSNQLAKVCLGWQPEFTLQDQIQHAWNFYLKCW